MGETHRHLGETALDYDQPTRRVRTRGVIASTITAQEINSDYNCSGPPVNGTLFGKIGEGSIESMTDYIVPNFLRRQAEGEIFFNPMLKIKESGSQTRGGGYLIKSVSQTCASPVKFATSACQESILPHILKLEYTLGSTQLPGFATILTQGDMDSLDKEFSTRVRANRHSPPSNLFEDWAERRKTLDMISRPLSKLDKLSLDALRRKKNQLLRLKRRGELGDAIPHLAGAKVGADLWLQYRYGILPAVNSITTVLQGLTVPRIKIRSTTRASGFIRKYGSSSFSRAVGILTSTVGVTSTDEYAVRCMSLDEYVVSRLHESGVSLGGFLKLPWELIPYSFVADWFINVEEVISALVPQPFVNQLGSCLVSRRERKTVYSIDNVVNTQPSNFTLFVAPSGKYTHSLLETNRRALAPTSFVVKNEFRLISDPLVTRQLTLLALVVQRLSRAFY